MLLDLRTRERVASTRAHAVGAQRRARARKRRQHLELVDAQVLEHQIFEVLHARVIGLAALPRDAANAHVGLSLRLRERDVLLLERLHRLLAVHLVLVLQILVSLEQVDAPLRAVARFEHLQLRAHVLFFAHALLVALAPLRGQRGLAALAAQFLVLPSEFVVRLSPKLLLLRELGTEHAHLVCLRSRFAKLALDVLFVDASLLLDDARSRDLLHLRVLLLPRNFSFDAETPEVFGDVRHGLARFLLNFGRLVRRQTGMGQLQGFAAVAPDVVLELGFILKVSPVHLVVVLILDEHPRRIPVHHPQQRPSGLARRRRRVARPLFCARRTSLRLELFGQAQDGALLLGELPLVLLQRASRERQQPLVVRERVGLAVHRRDGGGRGSL